MKHSRSIVIVFTTSVLLGFTACGVPSDHGRDDSPSVTPASNRLPDAAIIAVPLDSNGREIPAQANMRIIPQSTESLTGDAIASAYNVGRTPDNVLDEMDATSSTESCHGWGNYRMIGRPGLGYGYGYNQYQPTYYYGGQSFIWRYLNQFQYGNSNYYYYQRQQPQYGQPQYGQPQYGQSPWGGNGGYGSGMGGYYNQQQPIGYY